MKIVLIVVPVILALFLAGFLAYHLLAPDTLPKLFYFRVIPQTAPALDAQVAGIQPAYAQPIATQPVPVITAPQPKQAATQASPTAHTDFGYGVEEGDGIMYPLDSKAVNLAEPGGLRYLQATVVLEFRPPTPDYHSLAGEEKLKAEEEFKKTIDERRPKIDDLIVGILSSKTFKEIATLEGKQKLKEQIKAGVNETLGYSAVLNVYFTEFIVQ